MGADLRLWCVCVCVWGWGGGGAWLKDGIAMIFSPITFVFWGVADMNLCMNSA